MEETSNTKRTNQYSLSIQFSSDGFSLGVNDKAGFLVSTKTISCPIFTMAKNEIVKTIKHEADGLLNYQNIRLICESDLYTFVPTALFEDENKNDFLHLEHQIEKKKYVIYNTIATWESVNIFSIPINLKDALTQLFENVKIEQHLSYFLTDIVKQRNETAMYIWVRPKVMDVVVLINGNLHLINSYSYKTPEDFTYYTLNIFDQLSLNTETCKIKMYKKEGSYELKEMIQRYVTTVEVITIQ